MTDDPHAQARQHLEIFSILSFVMAGLVGLAFLAMTLFMGVAFLPMSGRMGGFGGGILLLVLIPVLALVGLYVATGVGLRRGRSWARTAGIVASAVSLLSFPFGTAYGVYGLWVLTRPGVERWLSEGRDPAPR